MFKSTLYHLLSVVCLWLYTVFLHCCALDVDNQQNGKTERRQCLRNCFYQSTAQMNGTQLKYKIASRQSCYEECLRKFGKKDFHGNRQVKLLSKRIKRDASNISADTKQENTAACKDAAHGNYTAVDKKNVTLTFHKLGKTDRFYAKISWTPPPESANWTGYKLIYVTGRDWVYNCIDLKKTYTSYIVNNSSHGLEERDFFRVKVLSLPQMDGVCVKYIRKIVRLTIKPTDAVNQGTTSSSPSNPTPSSIHHSSISDRENHFLTSPFSDNKISTKKVVIPIASVSITIAVAVVVYWYFRRSSKAKIQLGSGVTGVVEVQFDAYIIYSSADEKWVTRTLLPLLEQKNSLKCCVHYRDFVIGKPFRENMADCVYKSRKTVAVVSRSFFNSKYCNSEMDMALGRLLERGDDSLVVIKLDDVDRKKLPKALKQRSYIDYPKSTEKETWEKKLVDCLKIPIKHASRDNCV